MAALLACGALLTACADQTGATLDEEPAIPPSTAAASSPPAVAPTAETSTSSPTAGEPAATQAGSGGLPDYEAPTFDREDWLSWSYPNLRDLPEVPVIREVSIDEQEQVLANCMTDQGFASSRDESSGGLVWDYPTAQAEAFQLAMYTCEASYPLAPKYYQPFSVDQLELIHSWLVEGTVPCLRDHGLPIEEPPTLEAYVEFYVERLYPMWQPHHEVPEDQYLAMEEACPGLPPSEELYGR